jgi:hypothetical protein
MSDIPTANRRLASPDLRDRFLVALDEEDFATLDTVGLYLVDCENLLPTSTCALLGLKSGSTYGEGAEAVAKSRASGRAPTSGQTSLVVDTATFETPAGLAV